MDKTLTPKVKSSVKVISFFKIFLFHFLKTEITRLNSLNKTLPAHQGQKVTKIRLTKYNFLFLDVLNWFLLFVILFPPGYAWLVSTVCRVWWGRRWMMSCRPTSGTLSIWTRSSPLCSLTCRVENVQRGEDVHCVIHVDVHLLRP